jgi:hypothetical protein
MTGWGAQVSPRIAKPFLNTSQYGPRPNKSRNLVKGKVII